MLFRSVHMALLETLCRIYMYLHSLSLRPNAFGSAYCILVKKEAALCQSSQKPRARANGIAKRSRGPPLSLDHYSSFAPSQPVRRSSSASVLWIQWYSFNSVLCIVCMSCSIAKAGGPFRHLVKLREYSRCRCTLWHAISPTQDNVDQWLVACSCRTTWKIVLHVVPPMPKDKHGYVHTS